MALNTQYQSYKLVHCISSLVELSLSTKLLYKAEIFLKMQYMIKCPLVKPSKLYHEGTVSEL